MLALWKFSAGTASLVASVAIARKSALSISVQERRVGLSAELLPQGCCSVQLREVLDVDQGGGANLMKLDGSSCDREFTGPCESGGAVIGQSPVPR
jgi:hypothetical protein